MSEIDQSGSEKGSWPATPGESLSAARAAEGVWAPALATSSPGYTSIRRGTMTRTALLVAAVVMAGLAARPSLAENLLEIDVDEKGSILEVRDGQGQPLQAVPLEQMEQRIEDLGLDVVSTKSLLFGAILGRVGGEVAWCCMIGGTWRPCADGSLESTVLISPDGEVVEDPGVEDAVIAEVRSLLLKSHDLAVVEQGGTRYGMVLSADGTWYSPKELDPMTK